MTYTYLVTCGGTQYFHNCIVGLIYSIHLQILRGYTDVLCYTFDHIMGKFSVVNTNRASYLCPRLFPNLGPIFLWIAHAHIKFQTLPFGNFCIHRWCWNFNILLLVVFKACKRHALINVYFTTFVTHFYHILHTYSYYTYVQGYRKKRQNIL